VKRYLLSIYQPDGPAPEAAVLKSIMQDVDAVVADARRVGVWVFNGGLHSPETATVVRTRDEESFYTDGPYTEGKEHIGGFLVVAAPDLDEALEWGRRLAAATRLPVEVRPFHWSTVDDEGSPAA
jgi:hypothetical protein